MSNVYVIIEILYAYEVIIDMHFLCHRHRQFRNNIALNCESDFCILHSMFFTVSFVMILLARL